MLAVVDVAVELNEFGVLLSEHLKPKINLNAMWLLDLPFHSYIKDQTSCIVVPCYIRRGISAPRPWRIVREGPPHASKYSIYTYTKKRE